MLKTAEVIEQMPWNMTIAADYLRGFIENNKAPKCNAPPDIAWVFDPSFTDNVCPPEDDIDEDLNAVNTRKPQQVRVCAKQGASGHVPGTRGGPKRRRELTIKPATVAADADVGDEAPAAVAPDGEAANPAPAVPTKRRVTLADLPIPEGHALGCSKCRHAPVGCRACRAKVHIVQADDGSWVYRPPA